MQEIFCYKASVPVNFEKKEAPLAAKVEPSLKRRIEQIAAAEDRTVSYVVGALLNRGLSLFERDGNLRGDVAPARGKVIATISPGRPTKADIRRQVIGDDIDYLGTVDYTDQVARTAERVRLSLLKADTSPDDADGFRKAFEEATQEAGERIAKKRKAKS